VHAYFEVGRVVSDDKNGTGSKGYEGPQRTAPYPMSRLSAPHDLVRTAEEIAAADALIGAVAGAELEAIAVQIRRLQDQAAEVLERARRDAQLHRAECRFKRRPGQICHLYVRADGSHYWSLLSPDDWRGSAPHAFVGSYRLENDQRWTPLEAIAERDRERAQTRRLLGG
jgi:hypothetical protein